MTVDGDLDLSCRLRGEHALEHLLGEPPLRHARTPTRTLRKRAGAAG